MSRTIDEIRAAAMGRRVPARSMPGGASRFEAREVEVTSYGGSVGLSVFEKGVSPSDDYESRVTLDNEEAIELALQILEKARS